MKKLIMVVALLITLIFSVRIHAEAIKPEVHFIDIGQSDCILIKGEKNYLIDTGLPRTEDKVIEYLNSQGVDKIEDTIITHFHDDHYGGLPKILSSKDVKRVILPNHQQKYRDYIFSYLIDKNIKIEYINTNYYIKEKNIDLKVMLPEKEDLNIENNNGTVIYGSIDNLKYAFMADVEKEREKIILVNKEILNSDIMKVGHHGLDTSSTEELVEAINPRIAVITCDGDESPNDIVINRFISNKTQILRTDRLGSIITRRGNRNKQVEIVTNRMIE